MFPNSPIRVMVVDDSLVFGRYLTGNLPLTNKRIQIVGYASSALEAIGKLPEYKPDVITLDVEMPGMSGIEFLKQILPKNPIPVILVSSVNMNVFEALSYGAVDFVRKPDPTSNFNRQEFITSLAAKVTIASRSRVRIPFATVNPAPTASIPGTAPRQEARPMGGSSLLSLMNPNNPALNARVIAIGASTGGTEATLEVLKDLPANMPGIVVTQHMPEGFTKMYAERLNRLCKLTVKEASNGDKIERGTVLIAPGNQHMKVVRIGNSYSVSCFTAEKVSGHMPSVDVLFRSMADTAKQNGVGIILTGMGADGADGLLKMRQSGAYTIGQDKESCVVYGMPMVAHDIGGVCIQASCSNIPRVLINYLNKL